jgi:predicted ATP-grasp superfamily ATP-dependent carboligase
VAPVFVNGTAVVRELGRKGAYVVAVDSAADAPGLHSRYAGERCIVPSPGVEPGAFSRFLLSREDLYGGLVVPTDDFHLREMHDNRASLEEHFRLCIPEGDAVALALDKRLAEAAALEAGIAVPRTTPIETARDLDRAAELVGFPSVVKPVFSISFVREFKMKMFPVNNRTELDEAFLKAHSKGHPVVLKEVIPGGDHFMRIHVSYWDSSGECTGEYVCEKTLQHPPIFGVGQFVTVIRDDKTAEAGRRFLRHIGYRGAVASTEFKIDPRDGSVKFIELNPRTSMQTALSRRAGCDLVDMMWRDKLGLPRSTPQAVRYGKTWMYIKDGLRRYRGYPKHRVGLTGVASQIFSQPTFGLLSLDDPRPFVVDIMPLIKRRI